VQSSTPSPGFATERIYAADFWARPVVWLVVDEPAVGRAARDPARPMEERDQTAPIFVDAHHGLREMAAVSLLGNLQHSALVTHDVMI